MAETVLARLNAGRGALRADWMAAFSGVVVCTSTRMLFPSGCAQKFPNAQLGLVQL